MWINLHTHTHTIIIVIVIIIIIISQWGRLESLRLYLSNIKGKQEIKVIQKTAALCTAHEMREVLM